MKNLITFNSGGRMILVGGDKNFAIYARIEKLIMPLKDEAEYVVSMQVSKIIPIELYDKYIKDGIIVELDSNVKYDFINKKLFETIY